METYFAPLHEILVFGSESSNPPTAMNFTWVYHNRTWTNLTSGLALAPPSRSVGQLAYDSADGYAVLFGGVSTATGGCLNDTWVFNGSTWRQLHPVVSPPALYRFGMAYDSIDQHLEITSGYSCTGNGYNRQTWAFHAGSWTKVVSGRTPLALADPLFAYDPLDRYFVLYGGRNPTVHGDINDTWSLRNGIWGRVATHGSPPPLDGGMLAYDAALRRLVLFGGWPYDQTWEYARGVWTNLTPTLTVSPPRMSEAGFAYDGASARLILFGGENSTTLFDGTWAFS